MQIAYAAQHDSHEVSGEDPLIPEGTCVGDSGRYRLRDVIAIGGMATVYVAQDGRLGTLCAVKALYLPGVSDESEADDFAHEARIVASVQHPRIVAVRDYFVEKDYAFLVMDFIDGQDLYDRHRRASRIEDEHQNLPLAPIPEEQVVQYAEELAGALAYLHRCSPPIIYRDMKPHNVMRRTCDGRLILLDFGIARRLHGREKSFVSDEFGTPGYAAPEQYEANGAIDARTDIYGLGVMLIELATGYNPRAEGAERFVPPLNSLSSLPSKALTEILQRCVEIDPARRYQSMNALLDALTKWRQTPRMSRRAEYPEKIWTAEAETTACAPLLAFGGAVAYATRQGAVILRDAQTGAETARWLHDAPRASTKLRVMLTANQPKSVRVTECLAVTFIDAFGSRCVFLDPLLKPAYRFDGGSGKLLVEWDAISGGALIAASEAQEIALFMPGSGAGPRIAWRHKLQGAVAAMTSGAMGTAVFEASGHLDLIDPQGKLRVRRLLPVTPAQRVLAAFKNALLIGGTKDDGALLCLDGATGETLWRTAGVGAVSAMPLLCPSDMLCVPTRDCGAVLVDLETGAIRGRLAGSARAIVGVCGINTGMGLGLIALTEFGAVGRLLLYDLARGTLIWSEILGSHGAVAAPILCGEMIAAQDAQGAVHTWRWERCAQ